LDAVEHNDTFLGFNAQIGSDDALLVLDNADDLCSNALILSNKPLFEARTSCTSCHENR
jgi:hypothetical protein